MRVAKYELFIFLNIITLYVSFLFCNVVNPDSFKSALVEVIETFCRLKIGHSTCLECDFFISDFLSVYKIICEQMNLKVRQTNK